MSISFDSIRGEIPAPIKFGEELPVIPPIDSMVNTGWVNYFGAPVTSSANPGYDPTYLAVWEEAPSTVDYTIAYQTEHGTAPNSKTVTVNYGERYTLTADDLPTLTAEGYIFKSWTMSGAVVSVGDTISADTTLVAVWVATTVDYTISYQTEHGIAPEAKTVTVNIGESYILTEDDLPRLTDDCYAFKNWTIDGEEVSVGHVLSRDITLVAVWDVMYALIPKSDYKSTCDVIRSKTGKNDLIKSGDMAAEIEGINGGGEIDHSTEDRLVECTVTEYSNDRVTALGSHALAYRTELTHVSFPKLEAIGNNAFYGCFKLASMNFPKVASIGDNAFDGGKFTSIDFPVLTDMGTKVFQNNSNIANVKLDSLTDLGDYAFYNCKNLVDVDIPNLTTIGQNAFNGCVNFVPVVFPKVTTVADYAFANTGITKVTDEMFPSLDTELDGTRNSRIFANCQKLIKASLTKLTVGSNGMFYGCGALISADFPSVTYFGPASGSNSAFYDCRALMNVNLPELEIIYLYDFQYCRVLAKIDLPKVKKIRQGGFAGCSKLTSVVLRLDSVCTLESTNAFSSTPIATGSGYIYVPSALLDAYKTATNWSTYASRFRAIEDYSVDGTVTGSLNLCPACGAPGCTDDGCSACGWTVCPDCGSTDYAGGTSKCPDCGYRAIKCWHCGETYVESEAEISGVCPHCNYTSCYYCGDYFRYTEDCIDADGRYRCLDCRTIVCPECGEEYTRSYANYKECPSCGLAICVECGELYDPHQYGNICGKCGTVQECPVCGYDEPFSIADSDTCPDCGTDVFEFIDYM